MARILGIRFAPTEPELVNHYLKKQNLGDTSEIHHAISVVNICDYKPEFLPSLSKLKSDDPTWYYFQLKEFGRNGRKRATSTGFWKVTGKERKIEDVNDVVIGTMTTIYYYHGKRLDAFLTDWVIHEYDITSLPADKSNYVLCKLIYKGKDFIPLAGDNSSVPNHNLVFDSNNSSMMIPSITTGPQVQQPLQEEFCRGFYVNNQLTISMNQHVDHSRSYGAHTFFSDNNHNSHGVQLDDPNVVNTFRDGFSNNNNNLNITSPAIRTRPEVLQTVQEENSHGFCANDLAMAMNQHVGLPPSSSNNNNSSHGVQLKPPTELIHYLQKQTKGETLAINNEISVVKISDLVPKFLPSLSKLKLDDRSPCYYLAPKEYTSERMTARKRTTATGIWKVTGMPRTIRRVDGVQIGTMKVLVYIERREANAVPPRDHWVMHEYEITSLPADQRTYVLCKIMYNGNSVRYGRNRSRKPNHSVVIDSNNPTVTTGPEVQQPLHAENFHGSYVNNNHLPMPMNQHVDHSLSYALDANMFFNYNNNNMVSDSNNSSMTPAIFTSPGVQHPLQEEIFHGFNVNNHLPMPMNQHVNHSPSYALDASMFFSYNSNNNVVFDSNMTPTIITGSEVQQPLQEEIFHDFNVNNHLPMPMNQHVDHSPSYALDTNMFSGDGDNNNSPNVQLQTPYIANEFEVGRMFSDNNNNPNVQQAPYITNEFEDGRLLFSDNNNNLNMQPETPYLTLDFEVDWSSWPNLNTFSVPFGVEQQHGEETRFNQLEEFDIEMVSAL